MTDLTDIHVDIPSDIKGWITEGKGNEDSNYVFKTVYKKHLVNRAIECIANDITGDVDARETLLENIKDKVDELDPKKANKFCIKIVKLMKAEIESQLSQEINSIIEKKQVKTLEEFMTNDSSNK